MSTPHADVERFRVRGHEVSRLEALSDAVFALAMTLLIVSVEVPKSFGELMEVVRGFPAFAFCFAVLIWFWHAHYTFCRRYALLDDTTMVLNSVLLFVVLFYVYPLKFVFGGFIAGLMGSGQGSRLNPDQAAQLFVLYGLGFAAVWAIFGLMHLHAYRQADALELTPIERLMTRGQVGVSISRMMLAFGSIAVALCAPPQWLAMAGWVYFLMSITETAHGMSVGRRARALVARLGPAATRYAGPPSGTAHPPPG